MLYERLMMRGNLYHHLFSQTYRLSLWKILFWGVDSIDLDILLCQENNFLDKWSILLILECKGIIAVDFLMIKDLNVIHIVYKAMLYWNSLAI